MKQAFEKIYNNDIKYVYNNIKINIETLLNNIKITINYLKNSFSSSFFLYCDSYPIWIFPDHIAISHYRLLIITYVSFLKAEFIIEQEHFKAKY